MTYSDNHEFTLTPSYWLVLPSFLVAIALTLVGFPYILIYVAYRLIEISCWQYQFHEQTITERKGILSVTRTEAQFSRIKSIQVYEPFFFRLVGLSIITVKTSEPYMPTLVLYAIPKGPDIRKYLKEKTKRWRKIEGIREFDAYAL